MQLPNRTEFTVIALATMRIGARCCPLMPIFRAREMAAILRGSRSRVLFAPARFRGRDYPAEIAELLAGDGLAVEHVVVLDPDEELPGSHARWHGYSEELAHADVDAAALRERVPASDAIAQLLYTSGTSGEPKGVLHRFDALSRAAAMQAAHLGLTGDDRIYIPSPLAHQTGFLYGMWVAFLLGATQIVQPVWGAAQALRALREHGGTFCQAATPFLGDLVKAVDEGDEAPRSLRTFVATGAAVPRGLAERAGRVLGTAVCGAWGTTESCLGSLAAPGDEPAKMWGTDGRALTGVRIRVVDDHGRELAAGQEGHFEVSSKCLFEGYLDHPEWTKEVLTADGWYRSGDLAVIDESGYVRISGRVKDVVNRGGEKVPVAEIEQLLHAHPAIEDVAIVAMPDERLGERACAFVVVREDVELPALQAYLSQANVAKQYWPERLETLAELPRNPSGKVQKFQLREQAQKLVAADRRQHAGSGA
jgi:3-phosphoshikimate 1-carboxyvinyltransferase